MLTKHKLCQVVLTAEETFYVPRKILLEKTGKRDRFYSEDAALAAMNPPDKPRKHVDMPTEEPIKKKYLTRVVQGTPS